MRVSLFVCFLLLSVALCGQSQQDARGLLSLNVEKKITQGLSVTGMAAGIQTFDYQELGFAWLDAGLKYKLTRHWGTNVNYRPLWGRRLNNTYRLRHIFYADLDGSWGWRRWALGGTTRLQASNFAEFSNAGTGWLNRTKANLKYKVDYYWQPFVESELFTPLTRTRLLSNQWRASVGTSYSFNRLLRVEVYFQIQRQINRPSNNVNYLTAVNWSYRF